MFGLFILSVQGSESLSLGLKPFEGIEEIKLPPNQFFMLRDGLANKEEIPSGSWILYLTKPTEKKILSFNFNFSSLFQLFFKQGILTAENQGGLPTLETMANLDDFFNNLQEKFLMELIGKNSLSSDAEMLSLNKTLFDFKKEIVIKFLLHKEHDQAFLVFSLNCIGIDLINLYYKNVDSCNDFNDFFTKIRNFVINKTLERQKQYQISQLKKQGFIKD